jgi:hypothetical protein
MDFYRLMAVLMEYPSLALAPAVVFFLLFLVSKNRLIATTAFFWIAYLLYEYGMKFRILCSGECNIRIDLLVIYPALMLASLAGLIAFVIGARKKA